MTDATFHNPTITLKNRPKGEPTLDDFAEVELPLPSPEPGQILYRTIYLSLDPYLRGRMNEGKSYVAPFELGKPMASALVGQVIESHASGFAEGDYITGMGPWSRYGIAKASEANKLEKGIPLPATLGILGMPGLTAYIGLYDIGKPREGETVVVSAASGAVGSVVGQLAKLKGCRVVGTAGTEEKCSYVTKTLGFDACIDYKRENLKEALKKHCPSGVDVYFDNVGGPTLEAVLDNLNDHARIPLCGMISEYNSEGPRPGPSLRSILVHKSLIQGFVVSEHFHRMPEFHKEVVPLVLGGRLKHREDIVSGLENAPRALIGLLRGENFGKLIVQVTPE